MPIADFYTYGDLTLEGSSLLSPFGQRVLGPQARRVMAALMAGKGREVTSGHLLDVLWNGRAEGPGDAGLKRDIWTIRNHLALLQSTVQVENLHGSGYRLTHSAEPLVVRSFTTEEWATVQEAIRLLPQGRQQLLAAVL